MTVGKIRLMIVSAAAAVTLFSHPTVAGPCDRPATVGKIAIMADWLPWASQGPMVAAQQAGFYEDEGLEVEIIAPANPADPIKLVARERVQFSLTYVPEVMLARETGIPVVAVATTLRVLSSGLFFKGDRAISSPADLKGMTLGVGPKQDAQAFLASLLEAGGLSRDDVRVVDPGYAHVPMILTDRIDAAHGLTYSEGMVVDEELAKAGGAPVRWLKYTDFGVPDFYYQLIVGNEDWIKENAAATCRFLRATRRGLAVWLNSPSEAKAAIAGANDQFTADQHHKIYEGTKDHWLASNGSSFIQSAEVWSRAQDWALARKLITLRDDPDNYFTNDYLN